MRSVLQATTCLIALSAASSILAGQDYGDAPASYGLAEAGDSRYERLGTQWSSDATNPVTPAWMGDTSDDGVAVVPTWNAGVSNNSISIDVDTDGYLQYLTMWVDLNDDGDFHDTGERFDHPSFPTSASGTYTFNSISIPTQNYSLNGTDRIGVRFVLKHNSAITGPDESFNHGEIEDYLIDVSNEFLISTSATLPDGGYDSNYSETLQTVNGTGGISWQLTGGNLPPGISLSSSGDLTGTPTSAAAGQTYNFEITATDASSPGETDTKSFTLHVDSLLISGNSTLTSANEGQSYSETFTVANGSAPYSWTEIGSNLPNGLTLTQNGDDFDLAGTPGTGTGNTAYTLTIEVSSGTVSEQRNFSLFVHPPPLQLPFSDDFSVDKGWTLGSAQGTTWQIDVCGSPYAPGYGNPEPSTDRSSSNDNRILGDNIGATYSNGLSTTLWAESPAIDCSSTDDVELVFWRCLNVEGPSYDHAYISVSPDNGQTWVQVWENASEITDTGWVEQKLDISSVADNEGAVKVRFGIGPSDGTWDYAGWCIDDLVVRQKPDSTKLVLTDFEINSPYSVGSTNPSPRCYTGDQYTFDLMMDNATSNDIQVDSVDFIVSESGSTIPEDVGAWVLNVTVPFSVPANTVGHVISGSFDCTALSGSGANFPLRCNCKIKGTEQVTTIPVETEIEETFYVDNGPPPPPPSLEVHEIDYQGPLVESSDAAVGTNRDFGSVDIDASQGSWVNIILLNETGADVDVDEPILVGTGAAHFRLDTSEWTSPTITLTPNGATSQIFFSINFNPHDLGQFDAQIEFTHTASSPSTNPFIVPISGTGTGTPPELEVHEIDYQGPQITDGQPAAGTNRDFGSVAAGASSQWVNVVLWNRFATDTTIDPLPTITGADAADFDIDTSQMNNPHVIPGDVNFTGTIYFSIRFAPLASSSLGPKTATVTFGHDASNPAATSFTFEVIGDVTPPGPSISVYELDSTGSPSTAISNGDPATGRRDFGPQVVTAGATAFLEVEILNSGSSTLTLGTPTLTGPNSGDFVIDTTSYTPAFSSNVAPSATTKFLVAFDPTGTGTRDATVEISHNGVSAGSPFTFDVTGVGVPDAPLMGVYEGSASGPVIANNAPAAGTAREFGSRDINAGVSAPVTIFFENTGTQDLNLGTPALIGQDSGDFVITASSFPAVVAPQGSTTFEVAFNPTSFGNKLATVEFSHDDTRFTSPYVFEVTGFGDAPAIEVREGSATGPLIASGDEHDFGMLSLSNMPSTPLTIVIINTGNSNLDLPAPTLTGTDAGDFTLSTSGFPMVLAPSSDVSFTVAFDAVQVGVKEATVNIGHNAGGPNPFTLDLTGMAEDPNGVQITSSSKLDDARSGQSYSVTLQATGGTAPYTWAIRSGNLPPGLSLSSDGVISGQPADQPANHTFEVRVTDALGGTFDQEFSINVVKTGLSSSNSSNSNSNSCSGTPGGSPLWALLVLTGIAAASTLVRKLRG